MTSKIYHLVAATAAAILATIAIGVLLDNAPKTASANDGVTLTWYMKESGALDRQWQDWVIQAFQATHPTVTIHVIRCNMGGGGDCIPRLNGMWLQGNPPDVFFPWEFTSDLVKGRLADLTPFINGPNPLDLSDFFTETITAFTVDGKHYALPRFSGGSHTFYNKTMFDAAGVSYPPTDWDDPAWTWDAMVNKAMSLTQNYGDPDRVQYGVVNYLQTVEAYVWLWGQTPFPAEAYQTGFASEAYLDTPTATLAFQALQDSICVHHVSPSAEEVGRLGGWPPVMFWDQRAAMATMPIWGLWALEDLENVGFDWALAALPKGAPGAKDIVFTDLWAMSSATKHPAEAWEFIKFLVSEDAQRADMQITLMPPVRPSLMPEWSTLFSATMTIIQVQQVHTGALAHGIQSPERTLVDYVETAFMLEQKLNPLWNDCSTSVTDTLADADVWLEQTLAGIIQMYTVPTVTLDIDTGGLVTTNDGIATLVFGAGTVTETTVVSVTSEEAVLESPGLVSVGSIVHAQATISGTGEAVTQTNTPYTMTVGYDEAALGDLAIQRLARTNQIQESTLALYWWNPVSRTWEREQSSQVDTAANVVQATPTRFGLFAIFGKRQVHLPFVLRNY